MDAPLKRTIFNTIKNNNLVFKLILFAKIKSTKKIIKLFTDSVKKHSDAVTGLLLVYSSYTLCLIESSEKIIYEIGSNILSNDNFDNLEVCRCFPIHFSDAGRFFSQWYFKEIISKLSENFANLDIKNIYNNVISNLYRFYWELNSSDFLEGKLDVLAAEGSDRLPSIEILELLISNPWGYDLKNIINSYYNNLELEEDEIWPIQKIHSPFIDIRHN